MLCCWKTHNRCMHSRAFQICLFEGKSLKGQNPKADCQNLQLQSNLTMKAEISLWVYQISKARYPRCPQLEQWTLEELGSLEFCKYPQVCLKSYPRKAYSESQSLSAKLKTSLRCGELTWWSYSTNKPQGFQVMLFRINLWLYSQRSWNLVVDHKSIFLQEGRVGGQGGGSQSALIFAGSDTICQFCSVTLIGKIRKRLRKSVV